MTNQKGGIIYEVYTNNRSTGSRKNDCRARINKDYGLKLLHNHMTIEVVTKIFDYSKEIYRKLNESFRTQIFEEFAKSDQEGIIFTTTWDFDDKEEWDRIYGYIDIFNENMMQKFIL